MARQRDRQAEYRGRLQRKADRLGKTVGQLTAAERSAALGKRRRSFEELTPRGRQRVRTAGRRYGLSSRQARQQYDSGGFRPFARQGSERIPRSLRQRPERAPLEVQRTLATERARELIGDIDYVDRDPARGDRHRQYNDDAVTARINSIDDPETLLQMIRMRDQPQWQNLARPQIPNNPFHYH